MDNEIKNNPLYQIFKKNPTGSIIEEIDNPSNIPLLFDYLKDIKNSASHKIKIINKLADLIKMQRSICTFLSMYENKSIYIFLFDLLLKEKSSKELKQSIIILINELYPNIQISKGVLEYILQIFSKLYRKDKKYLSDVKNINEHYYDLLTILNAIFGEKKINKEEPRNYFACFGNNSFTLNFNKENFVIGNCLSFIINFKITNCALLVDKPELFGKCSLIKVNFKDTKKIINVELKYPFFVIINDGKKIYTAKVCPSGEWINLVMTLQINENNIKAYFFINGENSLLPITLKNIKLCKTDIINSISFFENFYGEVTSISMFSINQNNALNILSQPLKYFSKLRTGIWKSKYLNSLLDFYDGVPVGDKGNLSNCFICIFTPYNYNINQPNIVVDYMEKYNLVINGNVKNNKYQYYQKKLLEICNINNFLPIAEMLIIYQKELLNEKNLILYLTIVSKIVKGKKNLICMNESNFFQLLSLFLENIPNNILNENILNQFDIISQIIINKNMEDFHSYYFNDILLNEKIIFKYSNELQIKLWSIILKLCLINQQKIGCFITMKKICLFLRYYDKNRYNEMCCQFHLNMLKKELSGNIQIMKPILNKRLADIEEILNIIILSQDPEKIIGLYKLLMLDLSPCLTKFILKLFINALDYKNKNEEWKNNLVLKLINSKYDIIIINSFIHSFPDVRYEILILMNFIYLRLVKLNKIAEFNSFEKMLKTCLLPQDMFYTNKIINNNIEYKPTKEFKKKEKNNNKEKNKNEEKNKNADINENLFISKELEKKEEDKDKQNNKDLESKESSLTIRNAKSNSIYILASKFDAKNKPNNIDKKLSKNEKNEKINPGGSKTKNLKNLLETKFQKKKIDEEINKKLRKEKTEIILTKKKNKGFLNINNIIDNNKKQQNKPDNKVEENKDNFRTFTLNDNKNSNEYLDFIEGESIYNHNKKEALIFRDELYDIYINSLYIFFLKWTLGIPILYVSSISSELFSSLKQQKDISSKNYYITYISILEFIFVINNDLNNINFTYRYLKRVENMVKLPENSYIILSNMKIYSSLLDIAFKYYSINNNNENCNELEKEVLEITKNILVCVLINSLNYIGGQNKEPPMQKLEIVFLWGEKIILSEINDNKKINSVLDFIYELLLDILRQFNNQFGIKIAKQFDFNSKLDPMEIKNNIILKNYLTYLTFVYNFCFHYKVDPIIKNSDIDAFSSVSLNINIPDIFISGMRMDNSKSNNICEYWKDFNLIEDILNKINYIFKKNYILNKIKGISKKGKGNKEIKNKNNKKELNYDKYTTILDELILNKEKKDLFKKELFLICYYEATPSKIEYIIPLIRILSISLICILTIVKDSNDENQFLRWIKEYKNLLRFAILSSINYIKNSNNVLDTKIYNKLQAICFDIIGSGLCFLNNLLECSTTGQEIIQKYINDIFLLCFSILKYYYGGNRTYKGTKVLNSKIQSDLSSSAVIVLFNEYIKDKNKIPFFNINKLEKTYLNPSFTISDLINENEFYEALFENKKLKNKLFSKFYSINTYKIIVDNRYNLIRTLEDKIDYSYQLNILELLPVYEKEILRYANNSIKNRKKLENYYSKQKKLFFSWSGFWSNRELFYNDINYHVIKYKVINHYTRNLMRPLISPILDINYYLPEFTEYNKENMFNSKIETSYDLILDIDKIIEISNDKNGTNPDKNIIDTNTNIDINKVINENIKKASGQIKKDESKNNCLKQIYQKSNRKLYEFLKKITDFEKEYNSNNYINGNNKKKDIKDTNQIQIANSNTVKKSYTEAASFFKNNFVNLIYDKDNNKLKNEEILNNKEYIFCCLVKPSHHIKGFIYIREKKLNFKILKGNDLVDNIEPEIIDKDDHFDKDRGNCYGSYFKHYPKYKNFYKKSIMFNEIKWVLKRKYFYNNSAIEIFTFKNKSYYFNFKDEQTQDIIIKEIVQKLGNCLPIVNDIKELTNVSAAKDKNFIGTIIGYQNNTNSLMIKKCKYIGRRRIKISRIINQWKNWECSNFELLMLLNIFSNRSYNDISQYPVFPWLLSDHSDPLKKTQKEEEIEIQKDKNLEYDIVSKPNIEDYIYRDLSLPMGMLEINEDSIKRKKNYINTYKILKQDKEMKPYLFGCNYSNSTYVSNYLIRLFPFTQICIEIQIGGFDTPRRLFTSIDKAFKNAITQSTDVREIIPEFFYLPELFLNINNLNLGKFEDNSPVSDVTTPCGNNPYKYISAIRNILENENISYNINNWIDLIFGYKAKGKEAQNARNLFTEQSYQEDINIKDIKNKEDYLRYGEFGLIPNQLFNVKEFPKKERIEDVKKYNQFMDYCFNLKKAKVNISTNKNEDSLLLAVTHTSQDKLVFLFSDNLIIEEKISCSIFDKEYDEEIVEIKQIIKTSSKVPKNFLPCLHNNKNIKIINEGKKVIVGGFYDGKIIISNIENNTFIEKIPFKDESPITCIHVDKYEEYLFIGNSIGNIGIMQIENNNINEWKFIYKINAHLQSIISIDSNTELNIFISASNDGYVNIYTLPLWKITKSFKIPMKNVCNYAFISDSPLPSIITICQDEIFLYSINGNKIWNRKEQSNIINPIVVKDYFNNDYLIYILNNKEIFIKNIPEFSLQTKIEMDNDIYYLCPGIDMKILYAINKNGTQIDLIMCDTKKELEEK